MNQCLTSRFTKFLILAVSIVAIFLIVGGRDAQAAPGCFADAGSRAAARAPSSVYPRQNMTRNQFGCGTVNEAEQYVLISSYYHNGSGSPGSTVHTPTARFKFYALSQPTTEVQIAILKSGDVNQRCNYTGGVDVNVTTLGAGDGRVVVFPPGSPFSYTTAGDLDGWGYRLIRLYASDFTYNASSGVWESAVDAFVTANNSTSVHCRIRAQSNTSGIYVTIPQDANPTASHAEAFQRFNQNNAGTGAGSKRILGPTANGLISLYHQNSYTAIEYSIPFRLPCSSGPQNIYLRFYDVDGNFGSNPPGTSQPGGLNPKLTVYNDSTGQILYDGTPSFGNDEYGEVFIPNVQPNNNYSYVWYDITPGNGIQVWQPHFENNGVNGCTPPTCTISSVRNAATGSPTIYPGDQIIFNITVGGTTNYILGANGPNWGAPGNFANFLVSGSMYVRSPLPWPSANDFMVSGVGYVDGGGYPNGIFAPGSPGTYAFNWGLVQPGVGWSSVGCYSNVTVVARPPADAASCISYTISSTTLTPGQSFTATITFRNIGTNTWTPGAWNVGSAWWTTNNFTTNGGGESRGGTVPGNIAPGSNVSFTINGVAPSAVGSYNFQWMMVHEAVAWFGSACGPSFTVANPPDQPVTAVIVTANCTIVSGTATDPDWPAGGLRVHIRFDTDWPGKPNPDFEVFTNAAGQWQVSVPASYQNGSSHPIFVGVLGKNSSGVETSWYGVSGSGTTSFGPCDRPATGSIDTTSSDCRRIRGTATDPDWSGGGLRIHIRFDTPWPGKPTPDQEVFTDNSGSWEWTLPDNMKTDYARVLYVDIQGKDSLGVDAAWTSVTNNASVTIGPCKNSSCTTVSYRLGNSGGFTAIPNNSTITVVRGTNLYTRYTMTNNAPSTGGVIWSSYGNSVGQYGFGYNNGDTGSGTANTLDSSNFLRRENPQSGDIPTDPSESVTFEINNDTTSITPGSQSIRVRMIQMNSGWFGGTCQINVTLINQPAECGNITYSLTNPQPGDTFTATLSITNPVSGGSFAQASHAIRVTISGLGITDVNYPLPSALPPGGTVSVTTGNLTPLRAGEYRVTWALYNTSTNTVVSDGDTSVAGNQYCISSGTNSAGGGGGPGGNNGSDLRITNKPYVKFFSGDVVSGSRMEDASNTCVSPSATGKILAFAVGASAGGYPYGSSTELALFALNEIKGIYSTANRVPYASTLDNYQATFSNLDLTSNARINNSSLDAGNFGASLGCIPNYYNRFRTLPATNNLGNNVVIDPAVSFSTSAQYNASGNVTIGGSGAYVMPNGRRVALFVNGNVYITQNMTFAAYDQVSEIPSLWIIATGNIYINPSVNTIDGVLSATGTTAGTGTVYTCANGFNPILETSASSGSEIWNSCRAQQLHVNGSVSAKSVKLNRATFTLNCMRPGADISSLRATNACSGTWCPWLPGVIAPNVETSNCTSSAELFKSMAEVMIVTPTFEPYGSSSYERITALPPIY